MASPKKVIIFGLGSHIKIIKEICELNNLKNVVILNKLISNTCEILNCPSDAVDHCSFVWKNGDVGNCLS